MIDLGIGEVLLEIEDVADVGVAETVDRLILVADHGQVPVLGAEQLKQPVLGVVRILVLVDQHVAEGPAPPLSGFGEELEYVDRADQQVVEVHRVVLEHALLVEPVDRRHLLLEPGALTLAVGDRVDKFVLGAGDRRPHRPGWEALRIDLESPP